ncbi:hypothetical protein B296_00024264 [Ensete ventricosum]|uniref:Uncharacterized protein n=1 Tax=Ensete ventricosum TaxID=4639 RepID=A0A426XCL9_ENSVE|nr:hypothetical protein B296_00024264 [Ensete ventricosum]
MGRGSDDVVGNSPGVYRELAKGIESLLGWRKGVRRKKIETRRKITEFNHDGEKELQIRHGPRIKFKHWGKVWTMWWELIGSSLGLCQRHWKIARNMLGDRRKKTMRLAVGNARGCWIAGVRS